MGKLHRQHAEQHAAQDLLDRAQLFRAAARAARDLAFEMAASEESMPVVGDYKEDDFLLFENLKPLYERLKTAYVKAFRPSGSEFVNEFMSPRLAFRTLATYAGTTTFTQATANAGAVWKFGLGLRRVADSMEVYPHFSSVGNSRKLRPDRKGNLPGQALHHLVSALNRYGIGFREAAWKIASLGIELDAPVWTVQPRAPDAIDMDEVLRIEDRLKKVARRSRARARGNRGTNPP